MYDQNYITAYGTQTKVTAVALPAGTPMQLVAQNFNRHLLTLQVTGTAPATFGFGAAPPAAGQGLALDGAPVARAELTSSRTSFPAMQSGPSPRPARLL